MLNFYDAMMLYLNLDYHKLLSTAQKSLRKFLPACKDFDKDSDGWLMLSVIIFSVVCADGEFNKKEEQFVLDIILNENIDLKDPPPEMDDDDLLTAAERFTGSLTKELKTELLIFYLCAACIDGTISTEEENLLLKLYNQANT